MASTPRPSWLLLLPGAVGGAATPACGPVGGGTVVTVAGSPFGGATAGARCRFGAFEKDAVAAKLSTANRLRQVAAVDGAIAGLWCHSRSSSRSTDDYFPSAAYAPPSCHATPYLRA